MDADSFSVNPSPTASPGAAFTLRGWRKIAFFCSIFWWAVGSGFDLRAALTAQEKQLLTACGGQKVMLGTADVLIRDFIKAQARSPVGPYLQARFFRMDGQPLRAIESLRDAARLLKDANYTPDNEVISLDVAIKRERFYCFDSLDRQFDAERALLELQRTGHDRETSGLPGDEVDWDGYSHLFECQLKLGKLLDAGALLSKHAPNMEGSLPQVRADHIDSLARLRFRQEPGAVQVLQMYREAVELLRGSKRLDPSIWSTAAFHERRNGFFTSAEDLQRQIGGSGGPDSLGISALQLLDWAAADLRWRDALGAVRQGWAQLGTRYPFIRENGEKDLLLAIARLQLLHGDPDSALTASAGLAEKPVRNFAGTGSFEHWLAGAALTRSEVLRQRESRLTAAWLDASVRERGQILIERVRLGAERFELGQLFRRCVREQMSDKLPPRDFLALAKAPEWLWIEAIRLVGVAEARRLVRAYPVGGKYGARINPWIEILLAYCEKNWAEVMKRAPACLSAMPEDGDAVMRMQVTAALAEALSRSGQQSASLHHYASVMRICPSILILMDGVLPIATGRSALPNTADIAPNPVGFRLVIDPLGAVNGANGFRQRLQLPKGGDVSSSERADGADRAVVRFDALFSMPDRYSDADKAILSGKINLDSKKETFSHEK